MKKYFPLIIAVLVFLISLMLLQPEGKAQVVSVIGDLPAGYILADGDLELREIPKSFVPEDAVLDPADAVGKTLKTDRTAGDILRYAHLGDEMVLKQDERAVAIRVDDASGLGGLLAPGDSVGVTAVIFGDNAAFAKVTAEGFRVLYVSPEFRAGFLSVQSSASLGGSTGVTRERTQEGTVILAVPTGVISVDYDFTAIGGTVETRKVNAVEMLSALMASGNAKIVLYMLPKNPTAMQSSGLFLPDLILMPTPTEAPTPTEQPGLE